MGKALTEQDKAYMIAVGNRIKQCREELQLSQAEVAVKSGYKSRSTINKIELGQRNLSTANVAALAKTLKTTPAYLMGWTDDKNAEDTISPKKQIALEMFENLNDDQLEQITDFMRFLIEKRTK